MKTWSVCLALCSTLLLAQAELSQPYQMPPKEIAALIDAPVTPAASLSPNRQWMLLLDIPPLLTIADLAQPELKLAGLRFNPIGNDQSRALYFRGIELVAIASGAKKTLSGLPAGARVRNVAWAPDGSRFAFTISGASGVELWLGDPATASLRRIAAPLLLNNVYPSRPYQWLSDSRSIIARAVPDSRATAPEALRVPSGPVIQENMGRRAPARTYQDLLKTPHDSAIFEHHMQSRLVRVAVDGGTRPVGSAGMIRRAEPSPDARYLLVETVHRPFSFLVPEFRFPYRVEVWDLEGRVVKTVADLPLAEEVPTDFNAVPTGPRGFGWRTDLPATLYWIEAQDQGNPRVEAAIRDRLFALSAPFEGSPRELAATALRFSGIQWGDDDLALVHESWWKTRKTRTWRLQPDRADSKPQLIFDRSFEDRYSDPGSAVMTETPWGTRVLLTADDGKNIFLSGEGASPEGDRPFLDRMNLETRKATRLWRSEAPHYEFFVDFLSKDARSAVTRRESVSEPPNYFVRDLRRQTVRALTNFPHPTPQLAQARKELIRYKRADGVNLTGTLYLPPDYDQAKDGPLPVLMWAYPQEFKSAAAAGQVTDSPYRFISLSWGSPLFWLVRGYAVLDDPSIPIIGEGDREPNDTYVEQLVAGAQAAVDELARRGVGDRDRMAIGGHSYGAFMTANLMAHSDLFRAGIARSGAYNRSLTPFSFQAEERTFWEASETYIRMSPFSHAQKINEPLLLIHGVDDNNSGTFPIQSERLYQAMRGLGGTVRLVMLPLESHGYRGRESVMHMLWEMDRWLETYVKAAKQRPKAGGS